VHGKPRVALKCVRIETRQSWRVNLSEAVASSESENTRARGWVVMDHLHPIERDCTECHQHFVVSVDEQNIFRQIAG